MPPTLIAIEPVCRSGRGRRLVFDDGTDRVTSAGVSRQLRLRVGATYDAEALAANLDEAEPAKARERALRLLTQREHSVRELQTRLLNDGYPRAVARRIVDDLASAGLVDDSRFAEAWAHARAHQGYGRSRIAAELAEKGVDEALATVAVDAACPEDEITRAKALLRGRVSPGRKDRDRALRRLIGRGFDLAVALQAVDSLQRETADSESWQGPA